MTKNISYIAIFLVLAIAVYLYPAYASGPSLKEADISREILDNGLTVLVKEDHSLPIVSIEARFRIGSASEGEFLGSGISHFVEHMLFKGTPKRGPGDIEREIKSYGGNINGFTSFDCTSYKITVKSKYLKEALSLLVDAVMNPSFLEEEVEKERNVILKEIKLNNDNPGKRAFRLLWSNIYTTHPYKHPVIGYEDLFRKLNRQDLITYHNQHYVPNNLVLGICGDVNKALVSEEVKKAFKDYGRGAYEVRVSPREPRQITKKTYQERANVHLSRLLIGYHTIPIWHEDLFALDVLASVLGEGNTSTLRKRLVEKEQIAYSVGVYSYTPKDPGIFIISILLDEENISAAIKAVDEEIAVIKGGKIGKIQLMKAKNQTLSGFLLNQETVQAQAGDLVEGEILVGNANFSNYYVKGIQGVGVEEVAKAANVYLKDNMRTAVSLLPHLKEKTLPEKELKKDEIIINKFTLPNDMRILIREDHSLPVVAIRAVFKGGVRVEDIDTNGISNITAEMLLKGTRKRNKEAIYADVEKQGGSLVSFSGNNSFGVGMTVLKENLDSGLELLSDILQNPLFSKDELRKTKTLVSAAIKNREDDIFESGIKLFKQNLFKMHPYRFTVLGEKQTVEKFETKDTLRFYKQFCTPPNLVLAVFGDIDTKTALAKIKKRFKGFKGTIPRRLMEDAVKIKVALYPDEKTMDKEQLLIIAGFKTIKITDPDIYPFYVLSSILSGSDGRLFHDVRDKFGISYTQGVSSVPGLDRGYFLFYIATSKEHLRLGRQLIVDEIKKLQKNQVTDEELMLAKADLIGSHFRRLQSNRGLAFETSLDELYGKGYNNFKTFDSKIQAVTKEDISRIVKKYFKLKQLTVVTLGPLQDAD